MSRRELPEVRLGMAVHVRLSVSPAKVVRRVPTEVSETESHEYAMAEMPGTVYLKQ